MVILIATLVYGWVFVGASSVIALLAPESLQPSDLPLVLALVVVSGLLVLHCFRVAMAPELGFETGFIERIKDAHAERDAKFEIVSRRKLRPPLFIPLAVLLTFMPALAVPFREALTGPIGASEALLGGAILAVLLLAIPSILVILSHQESANRLSVVTPHALILVGLIFFAASMFPMVTLIPRLDQDGGMDMGLAWMLLGFAGAVWILGVLICLLGMFFASYEIPRQRLRLLDSDSRDGRATASGDGFILLLRAAIAAAWVGLYSLVILLHGTVLLASLCGFLRTGWRTPSETFGAALESVIGLGAQSNLPWTFLGSALLLVAALPGLALFIAALWGYTHERASASETLHTPPQEFKGVASVLSEMVSEYADVLSCRSPTVILASPGSGLIGATSLLRRGHRDLILIDPLLVDLLPREELASLLAHEIAHIARGDHTRLERCRLAGRLLLMGDAASVILLTSFGYEQRADRDAVERLGIDPGILRAAVTKLGHIQSLATAPRTVTSGAVHRYERSEQHRPSGIRGLVARWFRDWWYSFNSGTELAYWHPLMSQRGRTESVRDSAERTSEEGLS
ncbi:MAG: M48 family metalloprotease [Phycisphaerales bacterium]|nr:M48 family metalloprotease [Phycisphaerales bacterium]